MTKLKDKLSASVRTAKAAQQKVAPASTAATKSVTRPAARPASRPAAVKTAAAPAALTRAAENALFPDRVWPD